MVNVYFENANVMQRGSGSEGNFKETTVSLPIPGKGQFNLTRMVEELTVDEMRATQVEYQEKIALERKRQAVAAAWFFGAGQPGLVRWDQLSSAFRDYEYWQSESNKFETEIQMRQGMAWGKKASSHPSSSGRETLLSASRHGSGLDLR
jgi:hypothetical protein